MDFDIDKAMYWGNVGLLGADWLQTRYIAKDPNLVEQNPLLGWNPSDTRINLHFGGALLGNHLLSQIPHKDTRRFLMGGLLAAELAHVLKNKQIGVGFRF